MRLSTRFHNEVTIDFTIIKTFSLPYLSTFITAFLLEQKKVCTFLCFPQDIQIEFEFDFTFFFDDNHSLNRYKMLQKLHPVH